MSNGESASEYVGAPEDVLKRVLDESDKRIAAQVQLMLAGDLRANGLLAASATLAGAAFTVVGALIETKTHVSLLIAAAVFGGFATLAAGAAIWALWPKGVDIQGWSPVKFTGDIAKKKPGAQIWAEMVALNQAKLVGNDRCMDVLATRARAAMILLIAAPISAAAVLLLAAFCR
jgi:hypothetical protein